MSAFYNENDPAAAEWLRELIYKNLIAPGIVDTRSIVDIDPDELDFYEQCHFFAGIGGWSYALRLADWPDDKPVWTGSCPCQPFSVAGAGLGDKDPRHLWPQFLRLIAQRKPAVVFGEQVAGKAGLEWLSGVRLDLENIGYGVGAADLCSAGVGSPHIRQRLHWVADSNNRGCETWRGGQPESPQCESRDWLAQQRGRAGGMAYSDGSPNDTRESRAGVGAVPPVHGRNIKGVEHAAGNGREQRRSEPSGGIIGGRSVDGLDDPHAGRLWKPEREIQSRRSESFGAGPWGEYSVVACRDGNFRRFESSSFPLAYGVPSRVVRLRGYGNAINPHLASEFIKASIEALTVNSL